MTDPWGSIWDSGEWPEDAEFCVIHGYEHMKKYSIFDKFEYCAECEREREREKTPEK